MIKVQVRRPGSKPVIIRFKDRTEMLQNMQGLLKGCKVKILDERYVNSPRLVPRSRYLEQLEMRGDYSNRKRRSI